MAPKLSLIHGGLNQARHCFSDGKTYSRQSGLVKRVSYNQIRINKENMRAELGCWQETTDHKTPRLTGALEKDTWPVCTESVTHNTSHLKEDFAGGSLVPNVQALTAYK